jgi:anti-anti-sigma factor
MSFEVHTREIGRVVVIEAVGRFTLTDGRTKLGDVIHVTAASGTKRYILNLARVEFIDSFGIGELVRSYSVVRQAGGAMKVVAVNSKVMQVLTISRLDTIFDIYPDENAELDRYATVFLGVVGRSGQIEFVNAGHPSPILLRCGQGSEPFDEGSFPVGLMPDAKYHVVRRQLQSEDTLVLFSDGVIEAEDLDQQLFGVLRLRKTLEGQECASLDELQKVLLDSVRNFAGGASQTDDITLVLLRYRAAGTKR